MYDNSPNEVTGRVLRSYRKSGQEHNSRVDRRVGQSVTIGGMAPLHWHGATGTVIHVKPKTVDVAFERPQRNGWGNGFVRVLTVGKGDTY